MNCPTCSGALAALFTSTYCPGCEAKATRPIPVPWSIVEDEIAAEWVAMPAPPDGWGAWLDYYLELVNKHNHGCGMPVELLGLVKP